MKFTKLNAGKSTMHKKEMEKMSQLSNANVPYFEMHLQLLGQDVSLCWRVTTQDEL